MAMIVGDAAAGTGLAGALKTQLLLTDVHGNATGAVAGLTLNAFCNQMAQAIIPYVQANGALLVPVPLAAFGPGIPGATVNLGGTIA